MSQFVVRQSVDVDPLGVAAKCSRRPGTLLLHTQRSWNDSGSSALLLDPRWTVHLRLGSPPLWRGAPPHRLPDLSDPLRAPLEWARAWSALDRLPSAGPSSPVFAGLAGMISYDLGSHALGSLHPELAPFRCDDLWLGAWDAALVFGPRRTPEIVVADLSPLVPPGPSPRERLEEVLEAVIALDAQPPDPPRGSASVGEVRRLDPHWHREAVRRIHEHLLAGDCYQINLTGHLSVTTDADPWLAFLDQARTNPVAFAAFARCDEDTVITSHSPERLLRLRGSRADTAPIKGTRAAAPGAIYALTRSEKDLAEHVMIVDLERNDLGRHARAGSVEVAGLFEPLELNGLVHLVSRIEASYDDEGIGHALGDLFPGGSITGAPKRRAAQIISEIERHRRGPYTGSVGFVDRGGYADWNVAIRTAVWQNDAVHFGCGGGIVLDSEPEREYEEAELKARSFLRSLQRVASTRAREGATP